MDYLSDIEKSLASEFFSLQTTLASGLISMPPPIVKLTLHCKVKGLLKTIEDLEGMLVSD